MIFFILTTRFIVESGEYELLAFFFLVRCYEQLWCSILGLRCGVGRIMIKKVRWLYNSQAESRLLAK